MRTHHWYSAAVPMALSAIVLSGCLSSGGGSSDEPEAPGTPEVTREHDERSFEAVEKSFDALSLAEKIYFGKYDGLQGEAAYALEIPKNWDGRGIVMWTRGYGGEGEAVTTVEPPLPWRMIVLQHGYAWASSSYSANYYDVRAGIEDTNKLALNVMDYVQYDHGDQLEAPKQYLISGVSLGGHTAAAAVDRENMERTLHKVPYAGAAPFCQAEQNQFQWLGDYPRAMMELSGFGDREYSEFQDLLPQMIGTLFEIDANGPTWVPRNEAGQRLKDIARNLTGGPRPIFENGFRVSTWQGAVLGTGGSGGDINGILAKNGYGNEEQVYRWTTGPQPDAEEVEFNERIARVSADPDANPLRNDGVRWIPLVKGDFDVPVLTMHTLGDFYVPFRHQQLYREGAEENGNANMLVQRAIRAPGHCDFSPGEMMEAMNDWLIWVNDGPKPAGDEVLDPAELADPNYGCTFTREFPSELNITSRDGLPACPS
ncbi:alpha/beta hydrolase [Pseudomonas saliphila]|uniref:alpha/beta hydrolase n=1 Tax=Pseudomonas saliphila TaxID=2586906 RepID=UPI0019D58696|nr:alpha/beta hydrolase [Pseudomonas saliphila]